MLVKKIGAERVERIRLNHGGKIRGFCQHVTPSNFEHEDNAIALLAMSQNLGIDFDGLCICAFLEVCLEECKTGGLSLKDVASMCRLPLDYVENLAGELNPDPWETEEDMLRDLQKDSGAIRDGE